MCIFVRYILYFDFLYYFYDQETPQTVAGVKQVQIARGVIRSVTGKRKQAICGRSVLKTEKKLSRSCQMWLKRTSSWTDFKNRLARFLKVKLI